MPWKQRTPAQRREALIGANPVVRRNFKRTFKERERDLLNQVALREDDDHDLHRKTATFFSNIEIASDADWLMNHDEVGQTFELFWRSHVVGMEDSSGCLNDGGKSSSSRPRTSLAMRSTSIREPSARRAPPASKEDTKVICILPIGLFPGDEDSANPVSNTFLIWLQTYCKAFYFNSKVVVLPPVNIREVGCKYRVNQLTGRHQLHAGDIIAHLRKVKPKYAYCLIGVTMVDLYPRPSWDFVFGLATTQHQGGAVGGVGVFSFARFDDMFYETWTQGKDEVLRTQDGSLDYSVFDKPTQRIDGSTVPITDALLRRACNVMAHEIGHMFGLKHCVWMKCLMNGSNHLQESDRRPCQLCPVCLRKVQAVLNFNLVERYKALKEWLSKDFWSEYLHDPKINAAPEKKTPTLRPTSSFTRRTSLPEATRHPSVTSQSKSGAKRVKPRLGRASAPPVRNRGIPIMPFLTVKEVPLAPVVKKTEKSHLVPPPPLQRFRGFCEWLGAVIEYLEVQS